MKILVTGSSGFVGEALVQALAAAGGEGVAVSRRVQSGLPSRWRWVDRDKCLLGEVLQAEAPDWVIHLEVKHHVAEPGPAELAEFEAVNCAGTQRWLDWCTSRGVKRFLYFSSIKAVAESPEILNESASQVPTTPYGQSKREAEVKVQEWARAQSQRCALVIRPAVIYGPRGAGNIHSMIRALDRGTFLLPGRGENVKSLVSIHNVVAAVTHLIGRMERGFEIYNVVDEQNYSVAEIAHMISTRLGRARNVRRIPFLLARMAAAIGGVVQRVTGKQSPITPSRLRALCETTHFSARKLCETGFRHPQSTADGLAETVAWYQMSARDTRAVRTDQKRK